MSYVYTPVRPKPIFTNVIAIIAVILGIVSLARLPIALYPDITPPTIAVSASYPGADAETVAKTVGAPIELQVNGVENMIYMSSTSADDGTYSLTVTFALGTDVNIAMVLLQNLVNNALPLLPEVVQQQGVTGHKPLPLHPAGHSPPIPPAAPTTTFFWPTTRTCKSKTSFPA